MKNVTIDDVVSTVKELAKKYPNAQYSIPGGCKEECENTRGIVKHGPPEEGCIIGQSLRILGVPEDLIEGKFGVEESLNLCGIYYPPGDSDYSDYDSPINFLIEVQENQDGGQSWGDATKNALETMKGNRCS